jgi:hypothetical protein
MDGGVVASTSYKTSPSSVKSKGVPGSSCGCGHEPPSANHTHSSDSSIMGGGMGSEGEGFPRAPFPKLTEGFMFMGPQNFHGSQEKLHRQVKKVIQTNENSRI